MRHKMAVTVYSFSILDAFDYAIDGRNYGIIKCLENYFNLHSMENIPLRFTNYFVYEVSTESTVFSNVFP